ncbi:Interferon-induced protein 44 [Dissostichus eleginoides]|uniref:Interferon-induced protein 44 n=1 Tax=Dissostichus eleginoides TaxID=100907 RepID=A0AAD9ETK3_DISEL|nr:Interferon-induced protein 44 [Dissostichus eleginoides]
MGSLARASPKHTKPTKSKKEDIKLAMKGHVKDGYNFNPRSSLSENNQDYNRDPSLNDRVHVLVCIVPGSIAGMQDDSVRKSREVRLAARDMGIPEIAIFSPN